MTSKTSLHLNPLQAFANSIHLINDNNFEQKAFELFQLQYESNNVYRTFVDLIRNYIGNIDSINNIPFLPISFFKTHEIKSFDGNVQAVFESSATTGQVTSKHYVCDLKLYEQNCLRNFEQFYGSINQYSFYALLPSYLERNNSSLVYMVNFFMEKSGQKVKYFFLNDFDKLKNELIRNDGKKKVLFGVTYALLDFADKYKPNLENVIIIETGGMKGKRDEMTKSELHDILKKEMKTKQIHSEYGMTELLSQAYATENGEFITPNTMKVILRNTTDPFEKKPSLKRGAVNIIDLANVYTCAFIETQDVAMMNDNCTFSILGRMDNSDIRGCSLMYI
ncbi:MAG: acyl transferase [Bacteroidota bacterium]|nr:acyl transferase [Bacteroidota bacterium]